MTLKDKIIALLVKERKRGKEIAYAYKEEFDSKAKYGPEKIRWHYEKMADYFRQLGNNVSGSHALSNDTMEERVAREYEKELAVFDEEMKFRATRFAHECRLRGVVTNDETVNLYEELYKDE
jgi:hypothetical protein